MAFVRTRTAFGGYNLLEGPPETIRVRNAVVLGWALYDEQRLLVPRSAFIREGFDGGQPGLSTIGSASTTNVNIYSGTCLPEDDYVWIGHVHDHFGHFLASTLSRLWSAGHYRTAPRLVAVGPGDLSSRLETPFIRSILSALGISDDQFIEVSEHTIIPAIDVPEPLCIENSSIFREMSDFSLDVATRLAGEDSGDRSDAPLFLTKHALAGGVRNMKGEDVFAGILARSGVEVVSPEKLTLPEQIRLWRRHRIISAFEGSAMHAAIFVQKKKLLTLSSNPFAPSNQVLINEAAGHQSLYLNCADHVGLLDQPDPGFQSTGRLTDPVAAARSCLSAIRYLARSDEAMHMRSMRDTVSPWVFLDEPFGANVSRHKPAAISSVDPVWSPVKDDASSAAAGAVSGHRSDTYQIHTCAEAGPWWRVDLARDHLVTEIRVFNRNDDARHRARHLVISSSLDGATWEHRARRGQQDDFGGGRMPQPWRWWSDIPFRARHIRLHIETFDFLHLDQVEVFGLPLEDGMPATF